jgi:hypothetical protein
MTKTKVTKIFEDGKLYSEVTETIDDVKKPLRAHILIDNSSSMDGSQDKVISGVNEYVETLKKQALKDGVKARVSVSLFTSNLPAGFSDTRGSASVVTPIRAALDVSLWQPISRAQIVPNGMTPLLQAVGETIQQLEAVGEDVVLVILTDGGENSSIGWTTGRVKELMATKQNRDNWAVLYLGANQDAWGVGGSMGTQMHNTANFTMDNMEVALSAAGASSARYMSTRSLNSSQFTEAEISSMVDSGAKHGSKSN